ncbi:uncharacterized protein B4U79_10093 [Dinothrombium tinctorium]|uniref:Uncharacterized protein n=1 Tax=Dinothrombium tinctorium TaxID=1965070 RepID=A0A3S3PKL9_9ACAR|nr:uncharacterized protein B4U79_10093 [Dinothrombium tinctorium]
MRKTPSRGGYGECSEQKMLKFLLSFASGAYLGAYIAQNYQIPQLVSPQELYEQAIEYIEQYKKSGKE